MRVRPFPKSWLIHSITYEEYQGEDGWSNPIYGKPITIEHVRFDDSTVFSRDSLQTKILADAVIFVDAKNSKPIPEFKEESRITFNGRTLTLKKIVPCYYPDKPEIHHWELELL